MRKYIIVVVSIALVLPLASNVSAAQAVPVNQALSTAPVSTGSTTAQPISSDPQFGKRDNRYRLEPADTFDLNFDLSPEFNQLAVAVQPDGFVTLRGIGDVKVQGQTIPELTETIRQAYSKILNHPIISIVLKDFQKPYFVADGQVAKPGKYDLRGDVTLTEAIAMAGGFTEASKHSQVLLYRRLNDQWASAQIFNVKQMEKAGNLHEDPFIKSGDMLFVPKNAFSKIKPIIPSAGIFKSY
jgi:polysaccharide biosynthesis/export protein